MDLFTKADKQKEFPDSNTVLIHLKSNGKFNVTIHDNFLTVEPRGFTNAVNKGYRTLCHIAYSFPDHS